MQKRILNTYLFSLSLLMIICNSSPLYAQDIISSNYSGYYLLNKPEGKKVFDDIHDLMLMKIDDPRDETTLERIPGPILVGAIRLKQKKDWRYKINAISVKKHILSFITEKVNGFHYEFQGKFLTSGNFPEGWPNGVVLEGHLIKKRGSEVVVDSDVEFTYFGGD